MTRKKTLKRGRGILKFADKICGLICFYNGVLHVRTPSEKGAVVVTTNFAPISWKIIMLTEKYEARNKL